MEHLEMERLGEVCIGISFCGSPPHFGVQPAADKNFLLLLTVGKMRAFAAFYQKVFMVTQL